MSKWQVSNNIGWDFAVEADNATEAKLAAWCKMYPTLAESIRVKEIREVDKKVLAAAAFLDFIFQGWRHYINLDTLNMASTEHCILGQLFKGGYSRGDGILFNGRVSSHDDAFTDGMYTEDWKTLLQQDMR